ncbi:ribosomal large subunit pseudouridine synthase D [Candidatus Photodesmus katoptron]|uniref:Pseudouridine synthase n=1 Tax=Candidatus Photodesmus katoptron Akat1 TaxID=1236703 RepID=S3DJL9_9GAMM|nr:23S rRNA pseudouridine(1911/1915/1917) synthase RluD [Candidatus Photodesmus katoptron]EPE37329.1 ribosomal large subunit pseudouridine synthase D [Candidatus Photodesmus katoptron Akat1]KEY90000.1 ribosomal large subunit pseudouridine synthase D [Candidatus Photodesmus katoptron]
MFNQIKLIDIVKNNQSGQRLDQTATELFSDFSRSLIKKWLLDGKVYVNNLIITKPSTKVKMGQTIRIELEFQNKKQHLEAQNIFLDIVYEDNYLLVINKPRDFVVHPGAGTYDGTLLNALLYHYPGIEKIPRAGIVHRLDKNTTGLMIIAKTLPSYTYFVQEFQKRNIIREYEAIVIGTITFSGKIDEPISRHSTKRTLMAVSPIGKYAITHYQVIECFREYTHLHLRLETGRTHQIRVHMSYLQHPLLGDYSYGAYMKIPKGASKTLVEMIRAFDRQALHASTLKFKHPITGKMMKFHSSLPSDILSMIKIFREDIRSYNL